MASLKNAYIHYAYMQMLRCAVAIKQTTCSNKAFVFARTMQAWQRSGFQPVTDHESMTLALLCFRHMVLTPLESRPYLVLHQESLALHFSICWGTKYHDDAVSLHFFTPYRTCLCSLTGDRRATNSCSCTQHIQTAQPSLCMRT